MMHTFGMKVAVSIPDPLFAQVDALARRLKLSRSKVYARALDAFVADHDADRVTEIANALADHFGTEPDPLALAGGRTAAANTEW